MTLAGRGSRPALAGLVVTKTEYERVFDIYVPIAAGVFALVCLLILAVVLRYRRRPIERAARWHEHNPLESAYAVLLAAVVVFLLYVTFAAEHKVDTLAAAERPQLIVDVVGAKWEWRFSYPAYGIDRYSGTVGDEALVLPANEAVRLRLVSEDVIHEFWVPELRYKHDLIPGYPQQITVTFPRRGTFTGQCAEFCGLYHARMTFTVEVLSPARFAAWASSASAAARAAAPAAPAAAAAVKRP